MASTSVAVKIWLSVVHRHMYGSFVPVQSLSAAYSTGDKFARVFLCLKVSLILLLLSMERIPWTNQEAGYIIPIPWSPWIYRRKQHLSLGLRPRDRVVFRDKSLVTVV